MKANLLYREGRVLGDRAFVEMVIWELPHPLVGSAGSNTGWPIWSMVFAGFATTTRPARATTVTSARPSLDRLVDDFWRDVEQTR